MDSTYEMFNALGINQHHDAITGTGDQHVANDYARYLYKAMDINSNDYQNIINEKVQSLTGFTSQSKWEQCFRTNTTYLDCPVS